MSGAALSRRLCVATLAALALLLGACTSLSVAPRPAPVPPGPAAPDVPDRAERAPRDEAPAAARPRGDASNASQALLAQSRVERSAGRYPEAIAALERALRIDPNNPRLWVELGELHLQTGNDTQAETMARKALSLAGDDRSVENQAERLLRAASAR